MPMQDRSSKSPDDLSQPRTTVVDLSTGEPRVPGFKPQPHTKDPIAVELGKRGGLRGGKARAESLSEERRREIARAAAIARWSSKKLGGDR